MLTQFAVSWRGLTHTTPISVASAWLLGCTCFVLALRLVGLDLYPVMDTAEARYAEMARKMVESGQWLVPMYTATEPFWGKPPLAIWSFAAGIELFGTSGFAVRLPSWLSGAGTVLLLGALTSKREKLANSGYAPMFLGLLIYSSCLLGYTATGRSIIDPMLGFTCTLALVGFWKGWVEASWIWLIAGAIGLGLALMTKGPVGLVLVGAAIGCWLVWDKRLIAFLLSPGMLLVLAVAGMVAIPWYLLAEQASPGFLNYFLLGEHWQRFTEPGWTGDRYGRGHREAIGTIWWFALQGLMPWILVVPVALFAGYTRRDKSGVSPAAKLSGEPVDRFLWCWALAPLVVLTFARNIVDTYVMVSLPALAMLAGRVIVSGLGTSINKPRMVAVLLGIACLVPVVKFSAASQGSSWFSGARNQLPLVEGYQSLARTNPGALAFTNTRRRFSSEFYNQGQVQYLSLEAIENLAGPIYLAIRIKYQDQTPSVASRCELKNTINEYLLYYCPAR